MPKQTASSSISALVADLPAICTIAETAKFLRFSPRTVRRLIATGRLKSMKMQEAQQSRVLVPRASVEALIADTIRN